MSSNMRSKRKIITQPLNPHVRRDITYPAIACQRAEILKSVSERFGEDLRDYCRESIVAQTVAEDTAEMLRQLRSDQVQQDLNWIRKGHVLPISEEGKAFWSEHSAQTKDDREMDYYREGEIDAHDLALRELMRTRRASRLWREDFDARHEFQALLNTPQVSQYLLQSKIRRLPNLDHWDCEKDGWTGMAALVQTLVSYLVPPPLAPHGRLYAYALVWVWNILDDRLKTNCASLLLAAYVALGVPYLPIAPSEPLLH